MSEQRSGPLHGVRVIDLSRKGPGAFASMLLADLGADVVVIEPPRDAKATYVGLTPDVDSEPQRAAEWDPMRRNKRFVELDLKSDAGRAALVRLVQSADVFMETFRPGVAGRLGFDCDGVWALNPRVVYCSLSGYGSDGPLAALPGHDINYAAYGGLLSVVQEEGRPPLPPLNVVADWSAGSLIAVVGILAALQERARSGEGQKVDVSITDGVLYLMAHAVAEHFGAGVPVTARQNPLTGAKANYDCYRCSDDRWLSIAPIESQFWEGFAAVMGLPVDIDDAHLRTVLEERFATKTADDWFRDLGAAGLPVAPVLSLSEALTSAQATSRGMLLEFSSDRGEVIRQVGVVPAFSRSRAAVRWLGAPHGADTAAVLAEVGVRIGSEPAMAEGEGWS